MENSMIDKLAVGARHTAGDDHYYKIDDHTVINTIPALHILHGKATKEMVDNVYQYLDETNNNKADSSLVANISGDQSNLNVEHPLMKPYIERLFQSCVDYVNIYSESLQREFTNSPERRIEIDTCWSVKMNPGDFNPHHLHQTANAYSGLATVFYVKVPDWIYENMHDGMKKSEQEQNPQYQRMDGCLEFFWNNQQTLDDFHARDKTAVIPRVGDYYVFPKWLYHTVYPFGGTEQRWSVQTNFNVFTNEEWSRYRNA